VAGDGWLDGDGKANCLVGWLASWLLVIVLSSFKGCYSICHEISCF
jgi:hypothetical protein